jgi:hypothetical protein
VCVFDFFFKKNLKNNFFYKQHLKANQNEREREREKEEGMFRE